jgi:predicted metal-dependent hydrolase
MIDPESGHVFIGKARVPYSIRRSKRRRRSIGLLVDYQGEIRVLAPARTGLAAIEKLLRRQMRWIGRRLDHLNRRRELYPPLRLALGTTIPFRGENLTLLFTEDPARPQGCVLGDNTLTVNLPQADASAAARQEELRLEISLWYKKQAKLIFRERVEEWARHMGLTPRRTLVSNARRQWGSCSAGNDVRLNWRLIMAPPALLEYVIVHELAHIPHKNHGLRFWHMVEKYLPDYRDLRKQLRLMDAGAIV